MRTELRHGWGGNLKLRNKILQERKEAEIEREDSNISDKFAEDFKPTEEDLNLLIEMGKQYP